MKEELFFRKEATSSVILKEIGFNRATICVGRSVWNIDIKPLTASQLKIARLLLINNEVVLCDYDCWNAILSNFR